MTKTEQAVKNIHITDDAGAGKGGIHPLSRLLVTFFYILAVVSYQNDHLTGLLGMVLYLVIQCTWYAIPVKVVIKRIWPVLLLVSMVGIANPLLDQREYMMVANIRITYGMISMLTLMLKGIFCVMASCILIMKTGMVQICCALRILRVPKELVTLLLLMHRYMIVLVQEIERMQQAYKLRAPGQRGLHIRSWGSFAGLLLLRSMDRAQEVYESMKLRGFQGNLQVFSAECSKTASILYGFIWGTGILLFRIFPVFPIVGHVLAFL